MKKCKLILGNHTPMLKCVLLGVSHVVKRYWTMCSKFNIVSIVGLGAYMIIRGLHYEEIFSLIIMKIFYKLEKSLK